MLVEAGLGSLLDLRGNWMGQQGFVEEEVMRLGLGVGGYESVWSCKVEVADE